jgi:hypothetical protein
MTSASMTVAMTKAGLTNRRLRTIGTTAAGRPIGRRYGLAAPRSMNENEPGLGLVRHSGELCNCRDNSAKLAKIRENLVKVVKRLWPPNHT